MTEEQATKITQLLERQDQSNWFAVILCMIAIIGFIVYAVITYKQNEKKKKMLQEYESTLNDDQAKALAKWKELNK